MGEEGKKVVCEHCGEKFYDQSELKNHLFRHTGERQFVCSLCGKAYADKKGLLRHKEKHLGKKYECDLCGKEFTQSGSARRHKVTAHGVTLPPSKTNQKKVLDCEEK